MSLDQANAFRDYVCQNENVQRGISSALMTESAKISEIAAKHGLRPSVQCEDFAPVIRPSEAK